MDRGDVTVQIRAGGRSTRMGRDKALVELGGRTLLQRALDTWQNYGGAVQLSVGAAERGALAPAGIPAVADRYRDCGPLGGLHAGLLECRTELLLLTAVDCPFVTAELADGLLGADLPCPGGGAAGGGGVQNGAAAPPGGDHPAARRPRPLPQPEHPGGTGAGGARL